MNSTCETYIKFMYSKYIAQLEFDYRRLQENRSHNKQITRVFMCSLWHDVRPLTTPS